MSLLGTFVNGIAIISGSFLGLFWTAIPDRIKDTILQAMALAVTILGIGMGLKSEQFLIVIASLAIGGGLGEWWNLEEKLNSVGKWLETKVGKQDKGSVATGFVTATLVFVVGAMSIVGALDSGLRQEHDVLYTKALIDGFCAILFTSALGIGVMFSAVPVVLYQGAITLLATQIDRFVPQELMDALIVEITGTGGIMIVAIGLNLLGVAKIRVANLLPGLLIAVILVFIVEKWDNILAFSQGIL
ncbi:MULTISPECIES: DUF554 domain-containing protein [Fictibacillus]|jgi:uncharacterized protein|uniref:DUF554 domain-containing protein n=1 Tax=Fictibacillus TaxID=1329200 RepID=UPI001028C807|nr:MULTISPECIES: DUF554 domain-containing protein [Fictibacillus]RZT20975.1 hypothetical protein EV282_0022 [Fictibacillus sp. BK138]